MRCPYCDCHSDIFLETKDYNRRVSDKSFTYSKCRSCDLIFIEKIPGDLSDYYPENYHLVPKDFTQISRTAEVERYKIDLVRRFKTSGRMLEIGPSYGAFCLLAKESGFEVTAIEMDAVCCRFLESVVGVTAVCSADPAAEIDELKNEYDVIAFWHSIEHIPRSWEVIQAAAKRLVPGGILLIAAPNPAALQFRLFGKYWAHLDAPRHLYLYSMEWIGRWAQNQQLQTLIETTTEKGSFKYDLFGWRTSLYNLGTHPVTRSALKFVGGLLTIFFHGFERVGKRGSAYTIVLEKDDRVS